MSVSKYFTGSGEPRWRVEWRIPGRVKRRKDFRTEREAKLFEAQVIDSRSRGVVVDPRRGNSITVSFAYQRWLASRADLSVKVRRGYEDNWRLSVEPAFGAWPVTRVDRHAVQTWVNSMTVGPRTKRWRHSVLKMVLDYAVVSGWLVKNPAVKTTFPPLDHYQHMYLTADEVQKLADLCGSQGDVVMILAYTGLRFGELVGLNVEDVDLSSRRLHVRRSMTQVGGTLVEGQPKSRAGRRTVPIPRLIVPILTARLTDTEDEWRPGDEPAIAAPRGGRLGRENWVRSVRWNEQKTALGRSRLTIHSLRHTYASLSRSAGADLRLLQKTMGHASITVTAHTYADLYDGELDAVADALDALHADVPSAENKTVGPLEAHCEGQLSIEDELNRNG